MLLTFLILNIIACGNPNKKAWEAFNYSGLSTALDQGADVNSRNEEENNMTLLINFINKGELDCIKLLIEKGADVNTGDKNGTTPLYYAVLKKSKEESKVIIELLLDKRADINKKNNIGHNPLLDTLSKQNYEMAEFLITKGADVNVVSGYGDSTIMLTGENINLIKLLIDKGANINIVNNSKDAAIHYATRAWSLKILNLLLEKGADVSLKNQDGETALKIAINNKNIEKEKLLRSFGAKE